MSQIIDHHIDGNTACTPSQRHAARLTVASWCERTRQDAATLKMLLAMLGLEA